MRDLAVLFLHLLATVARLAGPGGARSVVAESVLMKHQLLILNRSRKRSPNLRLSDRIVAGLCALFMRPRRLIRSAIVLKPSTLLSLHRALTRRKYRLLFSSKVHAKPGPKGPSQEVVAAVVDMKRRNPTWGCPRIAQQITLAFSIPINKDAVRRILQLKEDLGLFDKADVAQADVGPFPGVARQHALGGADKEGVGQAVDPAAVEAWQHVVGHVLLVEQGL